MGLKKLKAVVVRGTGETTIVDPERFKEAVIDSIDRVIGYPERGTRLLIGSSYNILSAAKNETVPGKNFQNGIVSPGSAIWNLPDSAAKYLVRKKGAGYHCPFAKYYGCDLVADVKEGHYKGLKLGGVGYSLPVWEWGSGKCGINNFPAIWKCRELCNRYGMDQVTPMPFAMELYEKRIITLKDTGGVDLSWGNEQGVHEILGKIARQRGYW